MVELTWEELALHFIKSAITASKHFVNVCMPTNKPLNYLGNQNMQPTTAEEALDENNWCHFWQMKTKQPTIQHNRRGDKREWSSVTLSTNGANMCYRIDYGAQVNVISENQIETLRKNPRITKSTATLSAYHGSNIQVKGQCTLDI